MIRNIINFTLILLICAAIVVEGFLWAIIVTHIPNSAIQNGGTFMIAFFSFIFFIDVPIFVLEITAFIYNLKNENKKKSVILMTINYVIIIFSEIILGTVFFNDNIKYFTDEVPILIVTMIFIAIATGITMFNTYTNKMYEPR